MQSKFFSEPRALLLKISLPTEGITKTVLVGFTATLADVRQKLLSKLSNVQIPPDINNWAFLLTRNIEQMWLDDKVTIKSYGIKDGDLLEFKRKLKVLGKVSNMGPWKKAAPKTTAIYEHQLDRPVSPEPAPSSPSPSPSSSLPQRTKTTTDKLFDQYFEEKSNEEPPRPATQTLASNSAYSPAPKPRRNSVSRRKSNSLVSLLTKSSAKTHTPKAATPIPTTPKTKQKTNSGESPFSKLNPLRTTPPAMTPPPPQPAASKKKMDEISEEEMEAWLAMDDKTTSQQSSTQSEETDTRNNQSGTSSQSISTQSQISQPNEMHATEIIDILLQTPATSTHTPPNTTSTTLASQSKEKTGENVSNPASPRVRIEETDGYVRQQISKIDEIESLKERRARRRSRSASDARLSMMIKQTAEMEQQFNSYIETLTESVDKSEKTIDQVQDILFQMINRIDEGQIDVKGARRYAKKALDIILADAKRTATSTST